MESPTDERLDVVDDAGRVIGQATRGTCHGDPQLRHRAVHVIVERSDGRIVLQKRSKHKDVQPGRWDTSVGGHVNPGEHVDDAASRELAEELGIRCVPLTHLYEYEWRSQRETELVTTYHLTYDGPVVPHPDETDAVRDWTRDEIASALASGTFTPNFETEFRRFCRHQDQAS